MGELGLYLDLLLESVRVFPKQSTIFHASLSVKSYKQGIACMIDLICLMNFVGTANEAMTVTWICSIAIISS